VLASLGVVGAELVEAGDGGGAGGQDVGGDEECAGDDGDAEGLAGGHDGG
jgi:hypothetical protein